MYGYIYKTTNLVNGKIYIGQHKSSQFTREYLGSGDLVKRAIKKYGKENFQVELLEEVETKELMDEREIYWIKLYDAKNIDIGYNISDGGFSTRLSEERNGNCKCSFEKCSLIKNYLDLGYSEKYISELLNVSTRIIGFIRRGTHWSCKNDNYSCHKRAKIFTKDEQLKHNNALKSRNEKMFIINNQKKSVKTKEEEDFIYKWRLEKHTCPICGKVMTDYYVSKKYGSGVYCSKRCVYKMVCAKRPIDYYKKALKNRKSFKGENNPNYGKKASLETKNKISQSLKLCEALKHSKRFLGRHHTEESKKKTSESLRKTLERKKNEAKNKE